MPNRRILLALAFLLASVAMHGGGAAAQTAADRAAIEGVIRDQMAAFRRDDAPGAFAFAAPSIRAMFGTPDAFMAMVRGGYQPVYRPRMVEFRELAADGGRIVQRVLVVGPDGVAEVALYEMERQPDGSWRIAGCHLTRADERMT
ncbi:MAG: DUF4864 domain-containing protein [Alphaproteobacteria bacterium]